MTNTIRADNSEDNTRDNTAGDNTRDNTAGDNSQTKDFVFISFICQEQLEKVAQDKSC